MSAARRPRTKASASVRFKMKDLTALTGVGRPVVHFYIQQGLVPPGMKTGRNTALYGDEHVQRIKLIRQLQEEHFLPLKVIKAVLDAERDAFTPAQRSTLVEAMQRLGDSLKPTAGAAATVAVDGLLDDLALDRSELARLDALGVLAIAKDARGRTVVRREDLWVLQFWAELRDAGFTPALGFSPDDLAIYVEAIEQFIRFEVGWLGRIADKVGPERLAQMVDRGVPLIHSFLTRHHASKVRAFIAVNSPSWTSARNAASVASAVKPPRKDKDHSALRRDTTAPTSAERPSGPRVRRSAHRVVSPLAPRRNP